MLHMSIFHLFYVAIANSAIFRVDDGENKLLFNEMMMIWGLVCTRPTRLDWFLYCYLTETADRHVAPVGQFIIIPNQ